MNLKKLNEQLQKYIESAAMYKSNQPNFASYYNFVIQNPKNKKKSYFRLNQYNIIIPSDTILYDTKKHNLYLEDFLDCIKFITNIVNAGKSKHKLFSSPNNVYLCRIQGNNNYGITLQDGNYLTLHTIFIDHPNSIDNWIKTGCAGVPTSQLSASIGEPNSVTISSHNPNSIITYLKEKIKR